jgi:hypothetical protein
MDKKNNKKDMQIHKESYLMYEKTKKETIEKMSEAMNPDGSKKWTQDDINEKISMIESMQEDVKAKYIYFGGNPDDLLSEDKNNKTQTKRNVISKKEKTNTTPKHIKKKEPIVKIKNKSIENKEDNVMDVEKPIQNQKSSVIPDDWSFSNFSESFDVIPLPSKGECYDTNMSTIAVSYLTANDENMIVSPNLYRDGLILDYLLKAKIKNNNIDPDDLLEGDREAIILWLRATGYGTNYPITVTDSRTGVEFDTVVDLRQIKHKTFTLKGDSNGFFDYTLPFSKDEIKFRFLTHGDIKQIENIESSEQVGIKKDRLNRIVNELNTFLENEDNLTKDEKTKLYEAKRNISKWAEKIDYDDDMGYTHTLTNRLELSIVSINGECDREYISDYVQNMNVRDALALRKYINENEPGLDYTVTVERPESLGGGSMSVFLSLDEYVFLNIA